MKFEEISFESTLRIFEKKITHKRRVRCSGDWDPAVLRNLLGEVGVGLEVEWVVES